MSTTELDHKHCIVNGVQYNIEALPDGELHLRPDTETCSYTPEVGDWYWFLDGAPEVLTSTWIGDAVDKRRLRFGNCYYASFMAEQAADHIRRSSCIIRACLLIDPCFRPDWTNGIESKYSPVFSSYTNRWIIEEAWTNVVGTACVSTEAKAEQVIVLLNKWGIR